MIRMNWTAPSSCHYHSPNDVDHNAGERHQCAGAEAGWEAIHQKARGGAAASTKEANCSAAKNWNKLPKLGLMRRYPKEKLQTEPRSHPWEKTTKAAAKMRKGQKATFLQGRDGIAQKNPLAAAVASEASQSRTPKSMLMVIIKCIRLSAICPRWTSTWGLSLTALFVTLCGHL